MVLEMLGRQIPLPLEGEGKIYIKVKKNLISPTNVFFATGIKESILSVDKLAKELDISSDSNCTQMVFKDRKENTIKDNHTIWIS